MRLPIASLPLLALALGLAPGAAAQAGDSVPAELVRALLFPYVPPGEAPPAIVVGRLPDDVPAEVLLSGSPTVLGGVSYPRGRTVAFLTLPGTPAEAIAGYRARLERAGWRRSPHPEFQLASAQPERAFGLCGEDGTLLGAGAAPRPEGGSLLRVFRVGGEAARVEHPSYCHGAAVERIDDSLVPELRAPEGARGGGSGGGGTQTRQERYTRFVIDLPVTELVAHYAGQLREAGWTVGAPVGTGASAMARLERRDERGRTWRGLVIATAVADSLRDVVVRVVTAEPAPPPPPPPSEPRVAPAAAAQAPTGTLPAALVRALAARPNSTDGTMEEPELVVGRLPRGLPENVLAAGVAGGRVLGGAAYRDRSIAMVAVPGEPAQVLTGFREMLERAGWRRVPMMDFLRSHGDTGAGEYCGPDGASFSLGAIERAAGGSYLRLESSASLSGFWCRADVFDDAARSPVPALRAPEGAALWGGGWGGSSAARESSLRLQTPLSPAEVADHYAAQLRQAGWTTFAPASDEGAVTVSAEMRDERGSTWRALVAVTTVAPTQYDLLVRVMSRDER